MNMQTLGLVMMMFFGCLTTAVTWNLCLFFMGVIAPAWIVLTTLLLLALMTAFLVWVRRMPSDARRRGIKQGLLAGLIPNLAVMAYAWHRGGELADALNVSPFLLLGFVFLLPPFLLACFVSKYILVWIGVEEVHSTRHANQAARLLTVIVAITLMLFLLQPCSLPRSAMDQARSTGMKNRCRGIWCAIVAASMEREEKGLPALWPRDLGFTGNESSTDYFRRLMSDEAGKVTDDRTEALAPDLSPSIFCGSGQREAASAAAFAAKNNAWQVVCLDSNAPAVVPFLITRNADFGDWLTPTSRVRLIRSGPLKLRHVLWVTRGGGIFDARFKTFSVGMLFPPEGRVPGLATTSMVYRIMRP